MGEFRFIHCADLHLGARFRGVDTEDAAVLRRIRNAPLESFERIVDLAISERAAFMVVAGDLYDRGCLPATRAFFSEQAERAGIPIFISRGNHDTERPWDAAMPYPDNVITFATVPEAVRMTVDGTEVEIVGASYASKKEKRNLVSMMRGSADAFTVACVHCDVEEVGEGHPNAVCRMSDFLGKDVDYWVLGHVHRRRVLRESPHVVYSGNIQGRGSKESGPKGAYVVSAADGEVSGIRFVPTQSMQWGSLAADATGLDMKGLAFALAAEAEDVDVAAVTLKGSGELMDLLATDPAGFRKELAGLVPFVLARIDTTHVMDSDSETAARIRSAVASMDSEGRSAYIRAASGGDLESVRYDEIASMTDKELRKSAGRAAAALIRMTGAGP